jgi:small subunit ribosomal protein S8
MYVNDPISDLLTRIRNGQKAGHDVIAVPASKNKIAVTHLLQQEGFIKAYKCIRDRRQGIIKIALKYRDDGSGTILGIRRVSTPSRRVYLKSDGLPYVKNGLGVAIVSTSQGMMTDREARKRNIGGEYICAVY